MKSNLLRSLALGVAMCSLLGCGLAKDLPLVWKEDCVGRMQLSFPGQVEVAANSVKVLEAEYIRGSAQPTFEFADGARAFWSVLQAPEWFLVSPPLTQIDKAQLEGDAKTFTEQIKVRASQTQNSEDAKEFAFLDIAPRHGIAGRVGGAYHVSLMVGDSLVRTWGGRTSLPWDKQRVNFDRLMDSLVARKFGDLPLSDGVCLPYTFLRDDGSTPRHIAMTYRLVDHPDVTIMLKDANAADVQPHQSKEVLSAKYRTNDFWGQYTGGTTGFKSAWSPIAQSIKLAGQPGMQTFVQFVRSDGNQDYGYLAVASGDPHAKEDTPDLMLYVIQESAHAKARGIAPVSKQAFIEMAQAIASSVKRRPAAP